MTRYTVPSCTHVGPGRCGAEGCRLHEPGAHDGCAIAHAETHGPLSLVDVGDVLGLSHESIRLIEVRALSKIRRKLDERETP